MAMLTTVDNPHDPRLDFRSWYIWDVQHGYNTCDYLDKVSYVSEEFPDVVRKYQIEEAMDEIIRRHAGGIYKKLPTEPVNNNNPSMLHSETVEIGDNVVLELENE